jgi:CBS domain containing-hemolysin-like protein
MPMTEILIILITLIFSAFFSGMEMAYVSSNKMSLEVDKQKGTLTSNLLNIFSSNSEKFIATMLVGNYIALVIYGLSFARLLEPFFQLYFTSVSLILLLQTLVSTLIILITAEFLPKTLFRLNANSFLRVFALPVLLFYILLYPIANFSMFLSKGIIKHIFRKKIKPDSEKNVFFKIDLDHFVKQGRKEINNDNNSQKTEIELFKNALDFSKVKIRDCMVPRTEIEAIEINSPLNELRAKFIATGFSKIIVYTQHIDHINGYVHTSQLFKNPANIKMAINPISFVPETMTASNLLELFTKNHKSIAVVVDEFGGTSGLVTSEDILEEIFGEIEDEHDTDDLIVKKISDAEWILSARHEISTLNSKYPFNLPQNDDYDTIAGLIINHHENIPKSNSIITIAGFEFRILKATDTKIELVKMKKIKDRKNRMNFD